MKILILFFAILLSACAPISARAVAPTLLPSSIPLTFVSTQPHTPAIEDTVPVVIPTPSITTLPTQMYVDPRDPANWQNWPIVPDSIDPALVTLYHQGIKDGNNPAWFSKAGDCQVVPVDLFGAFDIPGTYQLGSYAYLQSTIDHFTGSWDYFPPSVHGGQNVAGAQIPASMIFNFPNNHSAECERSETFLDCEIRQHRPSILLISYEQTTIIEGGKYQSYLIKMVDYAKAHGIVPIVASTANSIALNQIIANVAVTEHIPLWNFWKAVQPLGKKKYDPGLNDAFHLSQWDKFVLDSKYPSGWTLRNLTGLQTIAAVWQLLTK